MSTDQSLKDNMTGVSCENLEIIELEPNEEDPLFDFSVEDLEMSNEGACLNELISDEPLYSSYLNGQISFDDLMREIHRREVFSTTTPGLDLNSQDTDTSNEVDNTPMNDPEFVPPPIVKRRRGRPRKHEVEKKSTSGPGAKRGTRKGMLSIELSHYLGEGERFLNNGRFDEAEEICNNVISQAPQASAPYTVLAEIYYRRGNHEKAREFLQAAAERCPTDSNLWLSLVEFAEDKNDLALALYYTRQAMRGDKQDTSIRQRLIEYLERAGRRREALKQRLQALSIAPEVTGSEQFRVARELANTFFKLMDPISAIRAYEAAFEKFPEDGTDSDKNTVLSMMVQQQDYVEALKFFLSYCGVILMRSNKQQLDPQTLAVQLDEAKQYSRCIFPRTLSSELMVKLFLVLVHLHFTTAVTPHVLKHCTNKMAETHLDWLLDIVRVYRKIGMNSTALELLTKLSTFEATRKTPVVWTLMAEIQVESGSVEDALNSYRHVVEVVAPRDAEARLGYGNLLKRVGKDKEALAVLHPSSLLETSGSPRKPRKVRFARIPDKTSRADASSSSQMDSGQSGTERAEPKNLIANEVDWDEEEQEEEEEEEAEDEDEDDDLRSSKQAQADAEWLASFDAIPDATLLAHDPVAYRLAFERCRMLDRPESIDSFLDETWTLLFSDVARLCGPRWAQLTRFLESIHLRSLLLGRLSAPCKSDSGSQSNSQSHLAERNVSGFDLWSLFLRLIQVLQSQLPRSLSYLESATAWGCLLPQIHSDEGRRRAASNLLISTCLLGGHGSPALIQLRELRNRYGQYNQFWNLMNIAITLSRDLKHSRFVDRVFMKESTNYAAALLANNDRIVRGSYRYAIGRLIQMRQMNPNDPMVMLLLSVGFLGIALQKHVASRHPAVLQALGFIAEYRRARGHCQEVYYNIARFCHQLLLGHVAIAYYEKVLSMEPVGETEKEQSYTDLRPEAAFNLALLYRSQGNDAMAHHIIQRYLVI